VECLFCSKVFPHPEKHQEFLKHLLTDHKFVIGDVNLIANFPAYVKYWRNKFRTNSPDKFCTTMRAAVQLECEEESEEREFLFLSDVLAEDKELRKQLQMDRLEFVLEVQEEERRSDQFSRGCLFCRQEYTSAADLLSHMAFDHNFNIGQADNLVFIPEFLDKIEAQLEELVCLYCEKLFKSREVLKEHMRKKMHKKLNPKNKEWDKYYLVNYLESGKTWQDFSREESEAYRAEEEPPSAWDDTEREDNEDSEWNDWRDDLGGAVCLFCPVNYPDISELVEHMNLIHGFDFLKLKQDLNLNFYQQVKMINFIRRSVHLNTCIGCGERFADQESLLSHMTWSSHHTPGSSADWDQPQYYFPTYENDNLLCGLEEAEADRESEDTGFYSDSSSSFPPVMPEDIPPPVESSILQDDEIRRSLIPARRNKSRTRRH